MKKILAFILSISFFASVPTPVRPISKIAVTGGSAVSAAVAGALGYFAGMVLEESGVIGSFEDRYPKILVAAALAGVSGGLTYWILNEFTPIGRLKRAKKLLDKVSNNGIMSDVEITPDFIRRQFPSHSHLFDAICKCFLIQSVIRKVEELIRAACNEKARIGVGNLPEITEQLYKRLEYVMNQVRTMDGYVEQLELAIGTHFCFQLLQSL